MHNVELEEVEEDSQNRKISLNFSMVSQNNQLLQPQDLSTSTQTCAQININTQYDKLLHHQKPNALMQKISQNNIQVALLQELPQL